jgi:RNA polymerase sigma factor (sigma-70 family)
MIQDGGHGEEQDVVQTGADAPAGGARVTMELPSVAWEQRTRDRLMAGDEGALGECYDQYASFVYGLALRVVRDAKAAEDLTQDVFLCLWERPEVFDPAKGALRTWLGTLAHRRAVDHVRREEARRRRDDSVMSRVTPTPDVEEMVLALVTAERVREALDELPSEQRTAIELAYFDGKTYRQVALLLEQPEGTIKSRIRTGLMRLRHRLLEQGIDESWIPS